MCVARLCLSTNAINFEPFDIINFFYGSKLFPKTQLLFSGLFSTSIIVWCFGPPCRYKLIGIYLNDKLSRCTTSERIEESVTVGNFTFWISVSLRLLLSPKFGLRPRSAKK